MEVRRTIEFDMWDCNIMRSSTSRKVKDTMGEMDWYWMRFGRNLRYQSTTVSRDSIIIRKEVLR